MSPSSMLHHEKVEYRKIPVEESSNEGSRRSISFFEAPRRWDFNRYLPAVLISVIFFLTAIIFVQNFTTLSSLSSMPNQNRSLDWTPCGNTSAEARANGCHFDPMLISWVPEACYMAEPADEYDVAEFKWFSDPKRTQPVNVDLVRHGDYFNVFTDGSHHDQHCIYAWRKLSVALERRLPLLDSKTANFHHSTHCARMIRGVVRDALHMVDGYKGTYSDVPLNFLECVPGFGGEVKKEKDHSVY